METVERYYEILGITPSSSLLEINQAYIRAINALLPSRSSSDPGVQAKAQSRAKDINDAYERIKKAHGADAHLHAAVEPADQPASPASSRPAPSPRRSTAINEGAAFKAALEKAAVDKALSDRTAEEQALAGKAAAVIAAADATAATIAAAIAGATNPDAQARAEAARAAAERDAAERIAAAKAAAAKAAAAKAAEERAAAIARMTALAVQGLLLASLCVVTYIVCTKAILPLASARKGVSEVTVPRRSPPYSPPPRREAKLATAVSQFPGVSVAANGDEKPVENIVIPKAVPSPDRGQSPMNVPALRKAAEEGDAEAQKNLADIYAEGKGVTKDLREAVKWYRRAANKGNAEAQAALEIWNSR